MQNLVVFENIPTTAFNQLFVCLRKFIMTMDNNIMDGMHLHSTNKLLDFYAAR